MELPKDLSWEVTTNENGVEMITMPKFKMNEIVEYLKYADTELKKLRVADVVGQSEQFNCLGGNYAKGIKPCSEWCGEDICQKPSN
jgi:hypothetical protein